MGSSITNTGAISPEWANASRKVMTDITSTGGSVTPALNLIYGSAPRAYRTDKYEFTRKYSTKGAIPQVLRGGNYISVSGDKKLLVQFDPQIYKLKSGYPVVDMQRRSFITNETESRETFRMPLMTQHIQNVLKSLEEFAIVSRIGGVIATPIFTEEGTIYTDQNYGLIWSDSVGTAAFPTKMQTGVTMTNVDWGNAGTTLADIEANIGYIVSAAESKGLNPNDLLFQVGLTTFAAIAAKIDAYTGTTKRANNINYSVDRISGIITLGNIVITKHNYSCIINGTTYKFVEDKYITVCLKPQYNDWVYMPVEDPNALSIPILYWHDEVLDHYKTKWEVLTQTRQFLCPDTNGIFTVKVIA